MNISEVKKLSPFERLVYWINERESIRLQKEAGEPAPWTDDEILQKYRFCNVVRMDDKVSKWLMENWYKPYYNHKNMLLACAIARFFNLPSSLQEITPWVFGRIYQPEKIKAKLREMKKSGQTIYNGAYMVRGNDGCDKISSVMDFYLKDIPSVRVNTNSMEETHRQLCGCYGLGSFMAGQIVADLRHSIKGTWQDKYVWAPIGPGSQKGMNSLHGWPIKQAMNQGRFQELLEGLMSSIDGKIPLQLQGRMEAHDFQNVCCEFFKFNNAVNGDGRPKQLYRSQS